MNIELVPITAAMSARLVDALAFESYQNVQIGGQLELVREVVGQNLQFLANAPRPDPWGAYLAVDPQSRTVVGTCAYKAGPTPDRTVEIAYYTFSQHEGRGVGTAMARALCRLADESGQVDRVVAHTLPETNASNTLLLNAGFQSAGEVVDPDDGRVWRFERACDSGRGPSARGV